MEVYKKQDPINWKSNYFNNFYALLAEKNRKHREWLMEQFPTPLGQLVALKGEGNPYSPLMSSQTYKEFIQTVDKEAEALKLDRKKIDEFADEFSVEKLSDYLFPLYTRLREMGYNYYDLTA